MSDDVPLFSDQPMPASGQTSLQQPLQTDLIRPTPVLSEYDQVHWSTLHQTQIHDDPVIHEYIIMGWGS